VETVAVGVGLGENAGVIEVVDGDGDTGESIACGAEDPVTTTRMTTDITRRTTKPPLQGVVVWLLPAVPQRSRRL
jgi:hypothetical protein